MNQIAASLTIFELKVFGIIRDRHHPKIESFKASNKSVIAVNLMRGAAETFRSETCRAEPKTTEKCLFLQIPEFFVSNVLKGGECPSSFRPSFGFDDVTSHTKWGSLRYLRYFKVRLNLTVMRFEPGNPGWLDWKFENHRCALLFPLLWLLSSAVLTDFTSLRKWTLKIRQLLL